MDSNEVRREWAGRSGAYSPEYYAYYGPDERSEAVARAIERFATREARVLELGCSSGRHLAHLHEEGYDRLAGIDLNEAALEVMAETYPDLAEAGEFYQGAIEDVVPEFPTDTFDVTYSVETLQHIHPDAAWVFEEIARVTGDLVVTVENEGDVTGGTDDPEVNYVEEDLPLYYRDWSTVFPPLGFEEVLVEERERDTLRAFRSI